VKDKSAENFSAALEACRRGEVIVFPTETFYGLGADALNENAVARIVSLKGRNPDSPIAVIVADREMLSQIVSEVPPAAQKLIDRFWPGPLTLVLPAKEGLPALLLNREGKIGVRVSSHPTAARLTRELGRPLTATSANLSGQEPARTIQQARAYFLDRIEIYLDGGTLSGETGSTVAEVIKGKLRIIRAGEISSQELEKAIRSSRPA
jgi:L-threonylcarbamoyladenylate synthase